MTTFNRIWSNTLLTSSNSCFENILNTRCFLYLLIHRKPTVLIMPTLSGVTALAAMHVIVMKTCDICSLQYYENSRFQRFTLIWRAWLSGSKTFEWLKRAAQTWAFIWYVSGVYLLHSNPHISTVMVVELWWVGYDRVGCWTGMCRWYMQWVCACNLCWNRQQKQPLISSEIDLLGIQLTATLTLLWLLENVTLILKVWLSNP